MTTVYVTVPRSHASALARTLVEHRLAACVNAIPCTSTYRWEDAIEEDEETILIVKTTAHRYDALVAEILDRHPHEVPCIERFDEDDMLSPFRAWVEGATSG